MTSWAVFVAEAPDLAVRVRAALNANKHKTLATIRGDGAPRISGIETMVAGDDLWLGSMWQARKAQDLLRDPRFALHSGTIDPGDDPSSWPGEAKLSGRAEAVTDFDRFSAVVPDGSPDSMHLFRLDLLEVVHTGLSPAIDKLVIELWRPGAAVRRFER
ncbi:pyridoxamine 5'-phosphate oxidase family protein [Asanoa sp. WMMD1127]|uniref:pyridoxamine 5'-phosphate oxidase family protein n=1 Tax=Asanoa sp. WMMD1127 TaxID=3016107 RepID=UPI00241614AA|nr:pyridoxamine 5'-phosphate oxidase family protein [Asanoa sp. WMMD1127]MDG4826070.1 pyridoxamine 5'-phosphate oxidase family protein [Asanoa sp. WMMD1127]